jgi:SAM-dependent methyltransferase
VREYVARVLAAHPPNGTRWRVLEVGSYDVNGTVRDLFPRGVEYVGLDQRDGPGVDVVADIEGWGAWPTAARHRSFDVVVSTEMLEHTPHPGLAVDNMAECLVAGGRIILTTRAPGFGIHEHPGDYYRFTQAAVATLLVDSGFGELELEDDPEVPGVFATAVTR